jgi:hypothetical protein
VGGIVKRDTSNIWTREPDMAHYAELIEGGEEGDGSARILVVGEEGESQRVTVDVPPAEMRYLGIVSRQLERLACDNPVVIAGLPAAILHCVRFHGAIQTEDPAIVLLALSQRQVEYLKGLQERFETDCAESTILALIDHLTSSKGVTGISSAISRRPNRIDG